MKILISGTHGQVGSALVPFLARRRHEAWRLVRDQAETVNDPRAVFWNPAAGEIDAARLEGFDAVVHLGGVNLAARRWNAAFKQELRDSRIQSAGFLAKALSGLTQKPSLFVCASAIGIYGDRGEEELSEESPLGEDFLAQLCREWEAAAAQARLAGIRVAHLRSGMILSAHGGALKKMLLPFKLGLGGRIGHGRQVVSWIALPDLLSAVTFLIESKDASGAYNCCAPNPVTNRNFTRALARAVGMPAIIPLPAFAAKLALGEMAEALLLASQKVLPKRLKEAGFKFELPYLGEALNRVLTLK